MSHCLLKRQKIVAFDVGVLDLFKFKKKIKKIGEKKVAEKCDFQATSHRNVKKILKN